MDAIEGRFAESERNYNPDEEDEMREYGVSLLLLKNRGN